MASTEPRRAPRSGKRRPRKAQIPLSESAVVEAGLAVLRRGGLDAVTMRAVADELDTGPASLYAHVSNRDDLARLLFNRVAGMVEYPVVDPARWREQLRDLCVDLLEVLEAHPGISSVALGRLPLGPSALDGAEATMALLVAAGVSPKRAAYAADALFLIIIGNAIETDADRTGYGDVGRIQTEADIQAVSDLFRDLPADRYPSLVRYHAELTGGGKRTRFLFAIDTFIDGVLAGNAPGA